MIVALLVAVMTTLPQSPEPIAEVRVHGTPR